MDEGRKFEHWLFVFWNLKSLPVMGKTIATCISWTEQRTQKSVYTNTVDPWTASGLGAVALPTRAAAQSQIHIELVTPSKLIACC